MKLTVMDIEDVVEIVSRVHQISSPAFTMNSSTGADLIRSKIATARKEAPNIADKLLGYPIVYNEFIPTHMVGFGDLNQLWYIFDNSSSVMKLEIDLIAKILLWMKVS